MISFRSWISFLCLVIPMNCAFAVDFDAAVDLYGQKKYEEARQSLQSAFNGAPYTPLARYYDAMCLYGLGEGEWVILNSYRGGQRRSDVPKTLLAKPEFTCYAVRGELASLGGDCQEHTSRRSPASLLGLLPVWSRNRDSAAAYLGYPQQDRNLYAPV